VQQKQFFDLRPGTCPKGLSILRKANGEVLALVAAARRRVFLLVWSLAQLQRNLEAPLVESWNTSELPIEQYLQGGHEIVGVVSLYTQAKDQTLCYLLIATACMSEGPHFGRSSDETDHALPTLVLFITEFKSQKFHLHNDVKQIALDYLPIHLSSMRVPHAGGTTQCFMVTGHDKSIHFYSFSEHGLVGETAVSAGIIECIFPAPKRILTSDTKYFDTKQIVAFGCDSGDISLTVFSDGFKESTLYKALLDGPISSICIFSCSAASPLSDFQDPVAPRPTSLKVQTLLRAMHQALPPPRHDESDVHLLVCGALGYAVVYWSVLTHGLKKGSLLTSYDDSAMDSITCGIACDVNHDGWNELVLGTYCKRLLVFCRAQPPADAKNGVDGHEDKSRASPYSLLETVVAPYPVTHIIQGVPAGSPVSFLFVLDVFSLTVMQASPSCLETNLRQRLERLECIRHLLSLTK